MIVPSYRGTFGLRSALLLLAAVALAWAVVIAVSGGFVLTTSWGRFASRNPVNPILISTLALFCYVIAFRQHAEADVRRVAVSIRPRTMAAFLSAAALVIGIRYGTFVAGGSDGSGYISQAELWLDGELTTLAPEWARDAPWEDAVWSSAPLGYRPGGSIVVPTYSKDSIAMARFRRSAAVTPS